MEDVKTPAKRKAPAKKKPAARTRESKTSPRILASKQKAFEAAQMRVSGETLEAIGKTLKVSRQAVHQMLEKYYAQVDAETLANLTVERQLDLQRLDAIIAAYWLPAIGYTDAGGRVFGPEPKAAEMVLRCMKERREILGYGAATRAELSGPNGAPLGAPGMFVLPMDPMSAADWVKMAAEMSAGEEETAAKLLEGSGDASPD